ncbi:MAG: hypothetical protein A2Z50_03215 [Nitrospirae bacterium RBG_19FT_COMBO_42_15]|nr:MAG: hypothetical protein A2Z50_03215 [Nitrospirae bacterium RBG_19FT_COMBO_42_15]
MVKFVNIGFGNIIAASRIVAILSPSSAPMKRLKDEALKLGKLIDATQGRKTRAIIITDSDHIILSGVQVETIAQRINSASSGIASTEKDSVHVSEKDVSGEEI